MNNQPQHNDQLITAEGKATRSFQEFLDDTEYLITSRPPDLGDGKTRKRIVNLWWNETDATYEHEVI